MGIVKEFAGDLLKDVSERLGVMLRLLKYQLFFYTRKNYYLFRHFLMLL